MNYNQLIPEELVRAIVAQIPVIQVNPQYAKAPSFHWGDRHELVKFLNERKKSEVYPLVWMLLGDDEHKDRGYLCERDCEFIIATRETDSTLLYDERYEKSYKLVLNPLLLYMIEGLRSSSVSRIVGENWNVTRKPDYTESYYKNDNEHYTIDKWDAIKLSCRVEFRNNCLNTISWKARS